jgi:CDGSH-type Zn-finger protein
MSQGPPGEKQHGPYVVHCEPGRYAYCTCTRSQSYPYCDGTHRGTSFHPIKVALEAPAMVAWCACGGSKSKPYCDGSHQAL